MDSEKLEQLLKKMNKTSLDQETLFGLSKDEQELVILSAGLKTIPVSQPPKPLMRRRYAELLPAAGHFSPASWFSFRFAASVAIITFAVLGGLSYATAKSLPGQRLFAVKKEAEQLRVKFASNDIQKAYLQVQIAKKRVAEAQRLASGSNADPKLTLAAAKEATQATEIASKEVEILGAKAIKESSEPLLSSLADVSEKEKVLVSTLSTDADDVIALSIKNQARVSGIQQAVEVATAEEAITNLNSDPNSVLVSGQISQVSKTSLTVEKTVFEFNDKTSIVSDSGEKLDAASLRTQIKATVAGKKVEGKLLALKLTVFTQPGENSEDQKGEVKGEADPEMPEPNSTTPQSLLKPEIPKPNEPQSQDANPNQAKSGFIVEDPNPQYTP